MNTPAQNDIQRELEQRALRNVRGLVDKIEDADALDSRRQRRYLVGIVAGAVVVLLLMVLGLWLIQHRQVEGVINSTKPSPSQPAKP
jgi:hypothetical protein